MQEPTSYAEANEILNLLQSQLTSVLQEQLVGLYLYGSSVSGDFDTTVSDVDLLVAISHELDQPTFHALDQMHQQIIQNHPAWDNRLELAYVSQTGLKTFRTQTSRIGIISPGEAFHQIDAGEDWLMNWYMVRHTGQTLLGKPVEEVIDPIPLSDYIEAVKQHILAWQEWVKHVSDSSYLWYMVLTICRGLYTVKHGQGTSKVKACEWASASFPVWADFINEALQRRLNPQRNTEDIEALRSRVTVFLLFMIERFPE